MDNLSLNPYPNYSGSFDPIVDMNAITNAAFNTGKFDKLNSYVIHGATEDPWRDTNKAVVVKSTYDKDEINFHMNFEGQFMNNRQAYQNIDEKHIRDETPEEGQIIRNLQGASLRKGYTPIAPKKYVYIGKDGHRKLKQSILSKY